MKVRSIISHLSATSTVPLSEEQRRARTHPNILLEHRCLPHLYRGSACPNNPCPAPRASTMQEKKLSRSRRCARVQEDAAIQSRKLPCTLSARPPGCPPHASPCSVVGYGWAAVSHEPTEAARRSSSPVPQWRRRDGVRAHECAMPGMRRAHPQSRRAGG
jgi:hypothetical protein